MARVLGSIVSKELKDGLRDRRALITLFFMPVTYLAMMVAMVFYMLAMQSKTESFRLPVMGAEYAEPLMDWLREEGVEIAETEGDPVAAVSSQAEDMVLVIASDFAEKFHDYDNPRLALVYDRSRNDIQGQVYRLRYLVAQWGGRIGAQRLIARGVSPQVSNPVVLDEVNVADDQRLAAKMFFGMLPVILILTTFIASMGLAVDMMAGEREKQSLEPLLLNPVRRQTILLGKWLASIICTAVILLLTCLAIYLIVPALPLERLGIQYQLSAADLARALLLSLPLICLATILQLLLAIFAKSFKEAQSYISLLVILPTAMVLYVLFSDVYEAWQIWVPILGSSVLMEGILIGEPIALSQWLIALAVPLAFSGLLAVLLVGQLKREKIIYG